MNHRNEADGGTVVVGMLLGAIVAAVVATPFYGFAPVLAVIGALFMLAVVVRTIAGDWPHHR